MKNNKIKLFFLLIMLNILFLSCKINNTQFKIQELAPADSVSTNEEDSLTENERIERENIFQEIDLYIYKHEQIVLKEAPNTKHAISIPDSLLTQLEDDGYLWDIDMYYIGELSSKYKILFEDAVYGYKQYSPHGGQRLCIFDKQNILLGTYYMSMFDIPQIVSKDSICLRYDNSSPFFISFKDSIPESILGNSNFYENKK